MHNDACRLRIRARRGPSTICPECQHSAASPTAAADPSTAATPARAAPPVTAVLISFDHDRAEPIGTPILRPPSTPGDTPAAPTKLDALNDVDELKFADSVARFSHADWERGRQLAPTCLAEVRYTTTGRPPAQSPDLLSRYPSNKLSFLSDTQELTNEGRLHTRGDHSSVTRGGVISVIYKTHWLGLSEQCWGWEMGLQHSRNHILCYWAGKPDQHSQTNRLYRRMRIGTVQRELSRNNGEHFLSPDYACVTHANWLRHYHDTVCVS